MRFLLLKSNRQQEIAAHLPVPSIVCWCIGEDGHTGLYMVTTSRKSTPHHTVRARKQREPPWVLALRPVLSRSREV